MSIGAVSISTNAKKEHNGAPFPTGAANNGTSVDSGTGKIVLGNSPLSNDAELLGNRVIPMDGNTIAFEDVPFTVFVRIAGNMIELGTATVAAQLTENGLSVLRLAPGDGQANISLGDGTDIATFGMNNLGNFIWNGALHGQFGAFDMLNGNWQIGFNPGGTFNGAKCEVVGSLTFDYLSDIAGGPQVLDAINDRGKLYVNTGGAGVYNLPGAATAIIGLHYKFCVQAAGGITVVADGADNINIGGVQGSTAGSVSSSTVGSFLELVYVGNNQWIAATSLGPWVIT